jgi:hypothetical protein
VGRGLAVDAGEVEFGRGRTIVGGVYAWEFGYVFESCTFGVVVRDEVGLVKSSPACMACFDRGLFDTENIVKVRWKLANSGID